MEGGKVGWWQWVWPFREWEYLEPSMCENCDPEKVGD